MKADAHCPKCMAPVRRAIRDDNGVQVMLAPRPVKSGRVWVVAYDEGVPRVQVAVTGEEVPRREPLRYRFHHCGQ